VHHGKLQDCGKDKAEREEHEEVQGRGIGHLGQIRASLQSEKGHRQHGSDPEGNPISSGLAVQPEGHPTEDHQQAAGTVHLNQKVAHVTLQVEVYHQHGVLRWK